MRLLLLCLLAISCYGQIAVSEPVAEIAVTTNSTTYAFGAFTPASDAVLVMIAAVTGTAQATATVTGGLTWTQKCAVTYNTTDRVYALWAKTGSSPGSLTFTFNVASDAGTGAVIAMYQFTGADVLTADPIKQCATNATTAANPVATFGTALNTSNGYAAAFGLPRNPPTSTAPGSWTETHDTGYGTPTSGGSGGYRAGGETGTTVTFTSASAAYGIAAVEVYVAGAGPVESGQGFYRGRVK
jgi:hypothetical protein